jgi:GTP cyclohydrolase I
MSTHATPLLRSDDDGGDLPVSSRIRSRLMGAEQRYHANDNISAYVMDGEVDELETEVEGKMAEVLKSLVIDTEGDHNTPSTREFATG